MRINVSSWLQRARGVNGVITILAGAGDAASTPTIHAQESETVTCQDTLRDEDVQTFNSDVATSSSRQLENAHDVQQQQTVHTEQPRHAKGSSRSRRRSATARSSNAVRAQLLYVVGCGSCNVTCAHFTCPCHSPDRCIFHGGTILIITTRCVQCLLWFARCSQARQLETVSLVQGDIVSFVTHGPVESDGPYAGFAKETIVTGEVVGVQRLHRYEIRETTSSVDGEQSNVV